MNPKFMVKSFFFHHTNGQVQRRLARSSLNWEVMIDVWWWGPQSLKAIGGLDAKPPTAEGPIAN